MSENSKTDTNQSRTNEKTELDQKELDTLFEIAWLALYRAKGIRKDEMTDQNYRNLQERTIQDAIKGEKVCDTANLLARLKVVDLVYKGVIENNLPSQGLTPQEAKQSVYNKIFGKENEKQKEQDDIKVDFNRLYDDSLIAKTKDGKRDINYKSSPTNPKIEYNGEDKKIIATLLGRMEYHNAFRTGKILYKYCIRTYTKEQSHWNLAIDNVFSKINFPSAEGDEEYRKVVFEKLLSRTNINREGNEGYIGEVVAKEKTEYEVDFDEEDYTAVKEYEKQRERDLQGIIDEVRGEK